MSSSFFRELGIVADLKTLYSVRFQAMTAPDATHAGLADAHRLGHAARAPVSGVARLLRVVMFTNRRTKLAVICGVRPARGASRSKPARPKVRKRLRQRDTFLGVIFRMAAISLSCRASAANSTIRARSTTRAGSARVRTCCCKATRWSGLTDSWGDPHPLGLLLIRRERIDNGCYL
jgi:hypothetical protein